MHAWHVACMQAHGMCACHAHRMDDSSSGAAQLNSRVTPLASSNTLTVTNMLRVDLLRLCLRWSLRGRPPPPLRLRRKVAACLPTPNTPNAVSCRQEPRRQRRESAQVDCLFPRVALRVALASLPSSFLPSGRYVWKKPIKRVRTTFTVHLNTTASSFCTCLASP
jgi:hypothetical protein